MKSLLMIVGMKHRGMEKFGAGLPKGETLTLVREPTNQFDQNAVQVWAQGQHVGFVKGTQARDLARHIDAVGRQPEDGKAGMWIPATLAVTAERWPCAEITERQGPVIKGGRDV